MLAASATQSPLSACVKVDFTVPLVAALMQSVKILKLVEIRAQCVTMSLVSVFAILLEIQLIPLAFAASLVTGVPCALLPAQTVTAKAPAIPLLVCSVLAS
jgi:hypothetical protein